MNAADWYVATNGSGSPGTNWVTAFTNLQDGLNVATNGDNVYIAGHAFESTNTLVWSNRDVAVAGGYEGVGEPGSRDPVQWPTVIRQPAGFTPYVRLFQMQGVTNGILRDVILQGGRVYKNSGACLYIGGGSNIALAGVTLQNAYGYSDNGGTLYGAGLYVSGVSNLALSDCTIRSNTFSVNAATVIGAGIYAANSTLAVSNTLVSANGITPLGWLGPRGGGVYLTGGGSVFRDCVVRANYTGGNGGATYGAGVTVVSGMHTFRNCLVALNSVTAGTGDGVYVGGGTGVLENCTVAHNFGQGIQCAGGLVTVSNCIVWGNGDDITGAVALAYCDIEDGDSNSINGCISADPRFERGYYLGAGSPCVDTGSVTAIAAGINGRTTQAGGGEDTDIVDLGYHYATGVPAALFELYVSPEGTNTNSGTNWSQALRTVSKALSMAQDGTRIHIATGLYSTAVGEIYPLTASHVAGLQIVGTNSATTVLDAGAGSARVMTLSYLGGDSRIEGLTLTRGRGSTYGGALYCTYSSLTVADCGISGSRAYVDGSSYGGGVYLAHVFATISNCTLRGNWAQGANWASMYGGGLYASGEGAVKIFDTVFFTNYLTTGTKYGSGIYLAASGEPNLLRNVLIARNTGATQGGGIQMAGGTLLIENATVVSNAPEGVRQAAGSVTVSNSILWANGDDVRDVAAGNLYYCDVENGDNQGVSGCVSVDPIFADTNFYHLESRAGFYSNGYFSGGSWEQAGGDSPLIDAGPLDTPYVREPQPSGRHVNMGAYGNSPVASKTWLEAPGVFTSLTVHAYPPTNVGTNYGTVSGEVLHTGGGEDPNAFICWGTLDGGTTDTGSWAHVENMGTQAQWNLFTLIMTNLTEVQQYRCFVTNSAGVDWSSLESIGPSWLPTVTNPGATSVRRRTAVLNGLITDAGGNTPSCWFYYWPQDGATTVVAAGSQTADFSNTVAGLLPGTSYTYRVLASNSAGAAWSGDTGFQMIGTNATWYVATNGDGTVGTNWTTAIRTIIGGLAIAETGDTINVAGQTFELQSAIVWSNSGVTMRGSYQGIGLPGDFSIATWPTIIRPQATYSPRLLQMQGVNDVTIERIVLHGGYRDATYGANLMMSGCTNITLREVTLRNGYIYASNGGSTWGPGAYVATSTNIWFIDCTITNNYMSVNASDAKGGALYLSGAYITFSNCLIRDNRIVPGGWLIPQGNGIYITGGGVGFVRSIIAKNSSTAGSTADADGGGLYLAAGTHLLRNCLLLTNACVYEGDGIYIAGGNAILDLCTIANNLGYGVARGGGSVAVSNSIIWGNADDINGAVLLAYCDVENGDSNGVNGCVSVDPLFVDLTYYHLQSKAGTYMGGYFNGGSWDNAPANSPCLDYGDPTLSVGQEPMPNGGRVNLGAYGGTDVASMSTKGTIFMYY